MKWRNSKERELIAQGGSREQTLPTKNNPNPDLSDPQPNQNPNRSPAVSGLQSTPQNHLEAMAKTRLAFNETLWTLPPPLQQSNLNRSGDFKDEDLSADEENQVDEDDFEEDEEEISVT